MSRSVEETQAGADRAPRPAQWVSLVLGTLVLLLGVLCFIPGVTTRSGEQHLYGAASPAMLFGLVQVSIVHNVVYLVTGAVIAVAALRTRPAHDTLVGVGAFYLLYYFYGMFAARAGRANVIPVDVPGNWLHLGIAVLLLAGGLLAGRKRNPQVSTSPPG